MMKTLRLTKTQRLILEVLAEAEDGVAPVYTGVRSAYRCFTIPGVNCNSVSRWFIEAHGLAESLRGSNAPRAAMMITAKGRAALTTGKFRPGKEPA